MTRYEPAINGTAFMGMYSHATGEWVRYEDAQAAVAQARGNLSLAEEGLANAMQEIEAAKHDIERLQAAASAEANEVERLRKAIEDHQVCLEVIRDHSEEA